MTAHKVVMRLHDQGLSYPKIALLLGCCTLQVHNYKSEKTKKPGIVVAMHIYANVKVEGKPVVVEPYGSKEALDQHWELYKIQTVKWQKIVTFPPSKYPNLHGPDPEPNHETI